MRRFYVSPESLRQTEIALSLEESKHLREVLRLRAHDEVSIFDGTGNEFLCLVKDVGWRKNAATLIMARKVEPAASESALDLTLAIALLKSEKFDLVVQKAVELGVTRLVPLMSKRSEAKSVRLDRWQKIALEAAKQCGRARLMNVAELTDFTDLLGAATGTRILFAEKGGDDLATIPAGEKITAVVGAEGGWENAEVEAARARGFRVVTLGKRILRAETAAISIAAVLQHRFGDLN